MALDGPSDLTVADQLFQGVAGAWCRRPYGNRPGGWGSWPTFDGAAQRGPRIVGVHVVR